MPLPISSPALPPQLTPALAPPTLTFLRRDLKPLNGLQSSDVALSEAKESSDGEGRGSDDEDGSESGEGGGREEEGREMEGRVEGGRESGEEAESGRGDAKGRESGDGGGRESGAKVAEEERPTREPVPVCRGVDGSENDTCRSVTGFESPMIGFEPERPRLDSATGTLSPRLEPPLAP
ncbi:unnamed protein product [Closterium sp. Naga37s-1]|nr:unnamed protein product [Closterium sp. Naga37s-1]